MYDIIKPESVITSGFFYSSYLFSLRERKNVVHLIRYNQAVNQDLTLLISKASEALLPDTPNNHIGEGGSINDIIEKQKGIRFIINAGFNHYRKDFYEWDHQDFNVGDPVGIVKIREHFFKDTLPVNDYGYFIQKSKKDNWSIANDSIADLNLHKYILGCTPHLIQNGLVVPIKTHLPVPNGVINPPSYLGHSSQVHPRTAVAMIGDDIFFILVENNDDGSGGCTLEELQLIGNAFKFQEMLNLDGGGSSQFKLFTDDNEIINNFVSDEDKKRILGHVFILFDESLK
jgi:hypothetical protein